MRALAPSMGLDHNFYTRQIFEARLYLMQMQHLSKPPHCRVLRPLQTLFLFGITLITPRRESVLQPRKILIVVLDV